MALIKGLWGIARPNQVVSVLMVFILGILGAWALGGQPAVVPVVWATAIVLLLTVSIHYVNEYADVETDSLTERTPYSGGSGVLPSGAVPRDVVLRLAAILGVVGLILQLTAVLVGIHPASAFAVMAFIAAAGWAYSLPPVALSWRGLGEIDNALLGGMIMPVYGYLIVDPFISPVFLLACVPFVVLDFTNLMATTWPDRKADAAVGKFTLVTRQSVPQLRRLFRVLVVVGYTLVPLVGLLGVPLPVVVGSMLALPLSIWAVRTYTRQEDPTPAVWAMVVMLVGQLGGWFITAAFV